MTSSVARRATFYTQNRSLGCYWSFQNGFSSLHCILRLLYTRNEPFSVFLLHLPLWRHNDVIMVKMFWALLFFRISFCFYTTYPKISPLLWKCSMCVITHPTMTTSSCLGSFSLIDDPSFKFKCVQVQYIFVWKQNNLPIMFLVYL